LNGHLLYTKTQTPNNRISNNFNKAVSRGGVRTQLGSSQDIGQRSEQELKAIVAQKQRKPVSATARNSNMSVQQT
jgi:hypothetical protein